MRLADRSVVFAIRHHLRGHGRLARALYHSQPGRCLQTTLNGMPWEADPFDWMDQQIIAGGYESEITDLLVAQCGAGGVLWDVGAHVGVHAVTVAKRAPGARVIAFEPSVTQHARLLRNARLNDVEIEAYCVALADSRGYRSFSIVGAGGNSGHNSLTPWPNAQYARTAPVWCDTVDELIASAGLPVPTIMKIDVEGAEAQVFAGARVLLTDPRLQCLIFESENPQACEMLTAAGFEIEAVAGPGNWLAKRPS